MAFLELRHGKLHYRLDGPADAPLLVFSNSLGTDLSLWAAQVPVFARNFRVLRYDTRGHGQSSVSSEPVTLKALANDVTALVDHVGAERFSFCGISLGGMTGMELALRQPERLNALVLSNTAARIGTPETWNARVESVRSHGMQSIVDASMDRWFTAGFRSKHSGIIAHIRECFVNTPPDGYIHCCEAIRDTDLRELVSGIRVPTLVIAGSQDPATTVEDARFLAEKIAESKCIEMRAAHLSNVEAAQDFSEAVSSFLLERDLFSKGMSVRRAVLGDTHVDGSLVRLNDFNREFQDLITRYAWGEIWTRPGLPRHTRSLITLALMVALNRGEEFRIHVRAACNNGVTRDQIKELLLQTAIYCGVPAANAAFLAAEQVFAELDSN